MEKPRVSIIVALAKKNVIGANNKLLWHLPADLKHFKHTTTGHTLIMGRKTYESIGRPLPGRRTIVVTKNPKFSGEGFEVARSLEQAFETAKHSNQIFVVGGAQIYQQSINLPSLNHLIVTEVDASFEGDAFFPKIDKRKWKMIERVDHKADERNPYNYSFLTYQRRKKQND